MRNSLIRAGKTLGIAAIILCGLLPFTANAQTTATASNQAKQQLTPALATSYWRECYQEANKTGVLSCRLVKDGVTTVCNKDLGAVAGDICVYTYPDQSRIEADPNLTIGATFKNYDSTGALVGTTNTAPGGTDTGTLEGSDGYDTGAVCAPTNVGCWLGKLPGMLFSALGYIFLLLSSGILYIAGTVFNWVVIRTVFQFGTYFGTSDGMLIAWGVVRDISNIGLLFGFIFMGVLLILNVDGGGGHGHGGGISAKKAIPRLILFAVLLNFSLFASQAVIDVSNAFSASFATLAGDSCSGDTSSGDAATGGQAVSDCANNGIAGKILQVAGVSRIWDVEGFEEGMKNLIDRPYSYSISLIMLSIFVLITAVVLLAGAIMLIIRVVVLSLLMVTSPIGFAGMVIPKMQNLANMWWNKLISQAFFAPVYLLLIFISIKLSETLMGSNVSIASAIIANEGNTVAGNMQVVMVFLIVIGFMIGSLITASKMGAMGASFATNSASALVFGAATRGTNLMVGGAGAGISRLSRAGLQPGQTPSRARLRLESIGNTFQKSNIDVRRAPGMGALLGAGGITAGAKPAEHATFADTQHKFDEIRSGEGDRKRLAEAEQRIKEKQLEKAAHDGNLNDDPTLPPEARAERERNRQFLASLSVKELEALHGVKEGVEQIAQNLSPEQFDKLMASDKLTDGEKGKLKGGRFKALNNAITDGDAAKVKSLIGSMTKKDLENMPPSLMTSSTVLSALSDKQRDDLGSSDKRTIVEREAIKGSYKHAGLNQAYKTGGAAAITAAGGLGSLNADQVAKLDTEMLVDPEITRQLTPTMLAKLVRENKLSQNQMRDIGATLRAGGEGVHPGMKDYLEGPAGSTWM